MEKQAKSKRKITKCSWEMPMEKKKEYFELKLESLRVLGKWAADCAERALFIYEVRKKSDSRPRDAINGIREFSNVGKRTKQLRILAMAAYAASREAKDPAASAAAQSACLAASSAYTHPLADIQQTKHILGPAAYAALAIELKHGGDINYGNEEISWAIEHVSPEICEILTNMPERTEGKNRLDKLLFDLDVGLRNKIWIIT
jgi:hypothetical protein